MSLASFLLLLSTKTHTLRLGIASQGELGLQNVSRRMEADDVRGNETIRVFKYEPNHKN